MAPELFQGGYHSIYSDFWSLGCVLYELATGSPPFVSKNFEKLMNMILYGIPTTIFSDHELDEVKEVEGLSPEFNHLIKGLLQKDPLKRFTWDVCCN